MQNLHHNNFISPTPSSFQDRSSVSSFHPPLRSASCSLTITTSSDVRRRVIHCRRRHGSWQFGHRSDATRDGISRHRSHTTGKTRHSLIRLRVHKFWRGRVKKQSASTATVHASLDFIRTTGGIDNTQIAKPSRDHPEGTRSFCVTNKQFMISSRVGYVRGMSQHTYTSLKDKLLTNTIVETPAVHWYDFDCWGDCRSKCARSWVRL